MRGEGRGQRAEGRGTKQRQADFEKLRNSTAAMYGDVDWLSASRCASLSEATSCTTPTAPLDDAAQSLNTQHSHSHSSLITPHYLFPLCLHLPLLPHYFVSYFCLSPSFPFLSINFPLEKSFLFQIRRGTGLGNLCSFVPLQIIT